MTNLEVLMMDGCTKYDAKKHLEKGTIVYDDLEEHLDYYIEESGNYDLRKMVETGEALPDWGIVKTPEKIYYIEYVL